MEQRNYMCVEKATEKEKKRKKMKKTIHNPKIAKYKNLSKNIH